MAVTNGSASRGRGLCVLVLGMIVANGLLFVMWSGHIQKSSSLQDTQPGSSIHAKGDVPKTLLAALAREEFEWTKSTTPIPISTISVWMKLLLSGGSNVPQDLMDIVRPVCCPSCDTSEHRCTEDTLPIAPVRQWLNDVRFQRVVTEMCESDTVQIECDPNEREGTFGLTPMHLAALSHDTKLQDWLRARGADVDIRDEFERKPANLSFDRFISNSKRWAREAGRYTCDLPELKYDHTAADADEQLMHAIGEATRLAGEGEPFVLRGALDAFDAEMVSDWNIESFVETHSDVPVAVGPVPYAPAFNLSSSRMTLREYYDEHVAKASDAPLYVFDKDSSLNTRGYRVLAEMTRQLFPRTLIADPDDAGGIEGIHFYLGRPRSGAPFHIHADALNALVNGRKRWFVYTPMRTVYSRKPVQQWVDEDYEALAEDDKPMECYQDPGDVVYIPLDWGHAVVNLEENTYGYALEILNYRNTLSAFGDTAVGGKDEL